MKPLHTLAAAALLALGAAAQAAGSVEVKFAANDKLTDAGRGSYDIDQTVKALGEHIKSLGAKLPDGQALAVEVLDVDLAGELRPTRSGREIRVLRGRADWPRVTLRYTLSADGKTVKAGEEQLADMNYLMQGVGTRRGEAYSYERRMLDRWFAERFVASAK
jgi:hypothetical protein